MIKKILKWILIVAAFLVLIFVSAAILSYFFNFFGLLGWSIGASSLTDSQGFPLAWNYSSCNACNGGICTLLACAPEPAYAFIVDRIIYVVVTLALTFVALKPIKKKIFG